MKPLLPISIFFILLCFIAHGKDKKLDSLFNAGTTNLYNGNYDEAFNDFYKCKIVSEQLKDSSTLAESLRYLGEVCRASLQFDLGVIYLNQSLSISSATHDSLNVARVLNRLAALKFEMKDIPGTMENAERSLLISDRLHDAELSANNLNIIGADYTSKGEYEKAITYYNRAREIAITLENQSDLPNLLNNISNNYFFLGQYEKALPYATEALDLATKNKTLIYELEACRQLMRCYKGLGNYQKALEYSERATRINDDYMIELKKAQKSAIGLMYENERAASENETLKKSNEETKHLLQIQRMVSWSIITGLILVSGLFITVLVLYRQRRDSLQTLREQNALVEDQKQELQQLNQLKDTLLTVISHDFRSPLVTLHSMMQLLDMGVQSPQELTNISGRLRKHVHETIDSLDNIIFWSRTQMQGFNVNNETFNLRRFIDELINAFQPDLQAKRLMVENNIHEGQSISCDREVLRIILRNLFSNAIKFSHQEGVISLSFEKLNSHARISLSDRGTGISSDIKDKLFSHEHITTRGTNNEKGTGMGLILTRELVSRLGGTIKVESMVNKGSTFIIELPF